MPGNDANKQPQASKTNVIVRGGVHIETLGPGTKVVIRRKKIKIKMSGGAAAGQPSQEAAGQHDAPLIVESVSSEKKLECEGDIIIRGNCTRGNIKSLHGNITIWGNVIGPTTLDAQNGVVTLKGKTSGAVNIIDRNGREQADGPSQSSFAALYQLGSPQRANSGWTK